MKVLAPVFILFSLLISQISVAEERLNSREAEKVCHSEIYTAYSGNEIKFKRNPASSLKKGVYRFWINSTEVADGNKNSIRYVCELSRSGELITLLREDGRWKI
jgi:hypothetical protein